MPMISCKMMRKILCGNFEKSFLEQEKMASRNVFRHFLHANFFMFIYIFFSLQSGINLHFRVFEKVEIALAGSKQLTQFQLFEKLTQAN